MVDGIVTVTTRDSRNIDLPTIERPLVRMIRVRAALNTNAKSPIEVLKKIISNYIKLVGVR